MIFGIMKNRFAILVSPPHYSMDQQTCLAPALAAIHDFICQYNPDEIQELIDDAEDILPGVQTGDLAVGPARAAEKALAENRQDDIANGMWLQYQAELANRDR
jgi:hypothetical protein